VRSPKPSSERGLTLLEVLGVIVILAVLAMVLIPAISRPVARAPRLRCVDNLKNIGLAFRIFSTDHGGQWPMDRSITNQGTREWLADDTQLWRHWLQLSNELSDPKMLLCPSDLQRQPKQPFFPLHAPSPGQDSPTPRIQLFPWSECPGRKSYQTILSGDRNLTTNGVPVGPGRLIVSESTVVGFSSELHTEGGIVLMADGSVQQVSDRRTNEAWRDNLNASGLRTNVWLVP
jgi:prepilin-type N-terminal cleavage/methylation domain-containing protein/prepilin-type processing-associated H-X9-DG protein